MRRWVLLLAATGTIAAWSSAQGPSFDKLADADRQELQKRFEKEIWPLMTRNGKDGCVGCHSGGQVTALRLSGKIDKDFPTLVKEGFFIPGDAGSLLARITDKDQKRRMPLGKRTPWTADEVKALSSFVADLDKKQRK